jgi:hypothetical protein
LTADRRADEKLEVGAFETAEAHAIDDAETTAEMQAVNGNGRRKRKTSAAKSKAKAKPGARARTGARR